MYLYQETKALLNPASLEKFLVEKMKTLGTAACPPYHLAFVVGGTSAEACLKTVKLASTGYLDHLPTKGNKGGQAFRDLEMEKKLLAAARKSGYGAQFGGKYFAHDVRVVRLPRHGASCPVAMGVSCSADRNVKAKINRDGIWLEELDRNPGRLIPAKYRGKHEHGVVKVDLNRPMKEILAELSKYPVTTQLSLTGTIIVGRDIAHAKLKERIDRGEGLPQYVKDHPIYYAGPAKTPKGMPSGSFGPTTAGRMDSYVDLLQSHGGSLVMIAKGNRSQQVTDACKKHGGFYLGSIGGPAALLAQENIRKVEVLEYPELGMEAIWKIEVEDFPRSSWWTTRGTTSSIPSHPSPRSPCETDRLAASGREVEGSARRASAPWPSAAGRTSAAGEAVPTSSRRLPQDRHTRGRAPQLRG